jgi:FG-GAP-like repeat
MSQLLFETAPLITTGAAPLALAIADFNGDNQLDLVTANSGAANLSLSFGDGSGKTFTPPTLIAVGTAPQSIVAADFNGDGWVDLATANSGSATVAGNVSIGLNDGTGNFVITSFAAGTAPAAIVVGNFNADESLDIAVANAGSANVTIGFGNGDGTFTTGPNLAVGNGPMALVVGQLNGDDIDDLAIANSLSNNVTTFFGDGAGAFTAGATIAVGSKPVAIDLGDLNGDNLIDIAVANEAANTVSIAFGDGAGAFTVGATVNVGAQPTGLVVRDLNDDGKLDLATANLAGNNLSIALGNGLGNFVVSVSLPLTAARSIVTEDLNGDGRLDLVVTNATTNQVTALITATERTEIFWRNRESNLQVAWNLANGTQLVDGRLLTYGRGIGDNRVGTAVRYDQTWRLAGNVDLNGDSVRDFVYTRDGEIRVLTVGQLNGQTATVEVDREYTFASTKFGSLNGQAARPLAGWELVGVEDMTGDGQGDFVFYSRGLDRTVIWTTNQTGQIVDGGFVTSAARPNGQETGAPNDWNVQALGDFTGDGQIDILWRNTANVVVLWEMDGTQLSLTKSGVLPSLGSNFQVKGVGDFNGDGVQDLVWRDQAGNVSRIWTFGTDGRPTDVTLLAATSQWEIGGVADMNRDGTTDIVWRNNLDNNVVIWNIKDAAFSLPGSGLVLNFLPGGNQRVINPGAGFKIEAVTGLSPVVPF